MKVNPLRHNLLTLVEINFNNIILETLSKLLSLSCYWLCVTVVNEADMHTFIQQTNAESIEEPRFIVRPIRNITARLPNQANGSNLVTLH